MKISKYEGNILSGASGHVLVSCPDFCALHCALVLVVLSLINKKIFLEEGDFCFFGLLIFSFAFCGILVMFG